LHATNDIAIADWDKNQDYRVMVAFQDNRIYNFTLDGVSVDGWKRPNLKEEVTQPVQVFSSGAKHYVIVSGAGGSSMILGRNGDPEITVVPKFYHSPMSGFYFNRTNKKGPFLTTGQDGKVIFIHADGKTSEVTLNMFSPDHQFFYEDISGNAQEEFIFSDRNSLFYYNRNYKLIYSYSFRREISSPPFLLHGVAGKVMIGYVVPETNELYLFDQNGYRELESGIRGNTPFDVGYLENNSQLNLLVGAGKYLRNYRLPKP